MGSCPSMTSENRPYDVRNDQIAPHAAIVRDGTKKLPGLGKRTAIKRSSVRILRKSVASYGPTKTLVEGRRLLTNEISATGHSSACNSSASRRSLSDSLDLVAEIEQAIPRTTRGQVAVRGLPGRCGTAPPPEPPRIEHITDRLQLVKWPIEGKAIFRVKSFSSLIRFVTPRTSGLSFDYEELRLSAAFFPFRHRKLRLIV